MKLEMQITEDNADSERIEWLTQNLVKQLQDLDIDEIDRLKKGNLPAGAKGDPLTIGAIMLGISTVTIPSLFSFIQNWVSDKRRVSIEAPNGAKVEFVADKKYSQEEIIEFVKELNQVS